MKELDLDKLADVLDLNRDKPVTERDMNEMKRLLIMTQERNEKEIKSCAPTYKSTHEPFTI